MASGPATEGHSHSADLPPATVPFLMRTSSFWLGDGASSKPFSARLGAAISIVAAALGLGAGVLFVASWKLGYVSTREMLYDAVIPGFAGSAVGIAGTLLIRAGVRWIEDYELGGVHSFGRKALFATATSLLFVISCLYRALNIADEGAAMCRGEPTRFNAPVAGRFVATIGEVALVVQVSLYIDETAHRLHAARGLWSNVFSRTTSVPFTTMGPVLVAEALSWSGVLSGNSKFYCAEYVLWMIIAFTWAWDSAELLHKSIGLGDQAMHALILVGSVGLFMFNAFFEIPHFFIYRRDNTSAARVPGLWECIQERDSPLWLKRLPFFFCYFIGCSWSSVAVSYRFALGLKRVAAAATQKSKSE
mmetsp:Transcript_4098/g.7863  ORF Transcript_4098/g.7863 Transcript_4098/m.7863 type:complete len:362 (-) Transcript_4098:93-1178(-)